jgi:hypothetical protein
LTTMSAFVAVVSENEKEPPAPRASNSGGVFIAHRRPAHPAKASQQPRREAGESSGTIMDFVAE